MTRPAGGVSAFGRFAVVGSICAVTNLVLLYVLTDVAGLHYLVSATISFFLTNYLGFWLNKRFSFRKSESPARPEMIRYYLTMALSLGVNLGLMYVLVDLWGIWYLLASVIVTVALLFFNFFAHRNFSFS